MSPSPLYKSFNQIQRAVRGVNKPVTSRSLLQAMPSGPFKTLTQDVLRSQRQARREEQSIRSMVARGLRIDPQAITRRMRSTGLGRLAAQVQRYASGGGTLASIASSFLDSLGPIGTLIRTLAASTSRSGSRFERDIDALQNMFDAFGVEATDLTKMPLDDLINRTEIIERQLGERGRPVDQIGNIPGKTPIDRNPQLGVAGGWDDRTSQGQQRQSIPGDPGEPQTTYNIIDPIVTGEVQEAAGSSHVHSYRYDKDNAVLYVRYKGGQGKNRSGPGPLYEYYDIQPEQFRSIMSAPSKGVWIWDELRVRGTQFEHQVRYDLAGIVGDYVPRRAMTQRTGNPNNYGEMANIYRPRQILPRGGQWTRSTLDYEVISTFDRSAAPQRAEPNRGAPNRGR